MNAGERYDVIVIGGGLSGLSLSIGLAQAGYAVLVLEKENYPLHRVCGEYLAMESLPFLERLGVPLHAVKPARITRLVVSAPGGYCIRQALEPGGIGISRFTLDGLLAKRALEAGVDLHTAEKVTQVHYSGDFFIVDTGNASYRSRMAVGSFGKRSVMDVQLSRPFILGGNKRLDNYIGVKYHIRIDLPADQIALHNFQDGYCGVSKVDGDQHCLCYLTLADQLKKAGGALPALEEKILGKNPFLRDIFTKAEFVRPRPETIAQISFARKSTVERHLLMTGDAAGMISPLCGNGMSIALHSGQLAMTSLREFLDGRIGREEMETRYQAEWKRHFAGRLRAGRLLQSLFGRPTATNLFLRSLGPFPKIRAALIRRTHGNPF